MMSDNKFRTTKVTLRKGEVGDMQTEWWTQVDWDKHNAYVDELKAKGEYLQEYEVNVHMQPNPMFDEPSFLGNKDFTWGGSGIILPKPDNRE